MKTCVFVGVLIASAIACKNAGDSSNDLPPVLSQPFTYPLNTKEGYTSNAVYKDTAYKTAITLNSLGDTVTIGTPYRIKGNVISLSTVARPVAVRAGTPFVKEAYSNVYPLPAHLKEFSVDESRLKKFVAGKDTSSHVLVNSRGDTIRSGIPVPISERVLDGPKWQLKTKSPSRRSDAVFNIQNLDRDQGLNLSHVTALMQDRQGYIWIGLYGGGLERFDGSSIMHFGPTSQGLRLSFITSILEDHAGNIWCGNHGGGAYRYDGKHFTPFLEEDGLSSNYVNCIMEDKEKNIWFGMRDGFACRYTPPRDGQPGTLTHFGPKEGLGGNDIRVIVEDRNGDIWFGSATGVFRYEISKNGDTGIFTAFTRHDGLSNDKILAMLLDKSGNLWIGTTSGACRYVFPQNDLPGKITQFILRADMPYVGVSSIYEDTNGDLWFGTGGSGVIKLIQSGVDGYEQPMCALFTTKEGLTDNRIRAILQDTSGNMWFGTESAGVCSLTQRTFMRFSEPQGFSQLSINAIYEDKDKNLWFGTRGGGVFAYTTPKENVTSTFSQYTAQNNLPNNGIQSVTQDLQGNMWFGTYSNGLCQFDGNSFTTYSVSNGLSGNDVRSVITDRKGNIWAGTLDGGVSCLVFEGKAQNESPVIIQYTEREGLLDNQIRSVYEDTQGNIWICSNEGISRFQPTTNTMEGFITHYTEKSGLPSRIILSVLEDRNQNIWIGTGSGISRLNLSTDGLSGDFTFYGQRRFGAMGNRGLSILEDLSGNMWLATTRGLAFIVNERDPKIPNQMIRFLKPDGLKGEEFQDNSALLDSRNRAWWGSTVGGVEMLDMNTFRLSTTIPQPRLQRLDIDETFLDFLHLPDSLQREILFDSVPPFENYPLNLVLPYTKNHLTFHFSAIDWTAPHKIRYSFRMQGLEDIWSQPSTETQVEYRSLPSGTYIFKVRAIGESQIWSEPFEYTFTIQPPWYLSMWAYLFYVLTGGAFIYALHRFQLNRKLEKAEKKRLLELDAIKNRLYTNITHEFRTPLTLIHGPVSLALSTHTQLDETDLKSIYRQSDRLQQLITQMLDLQKIEAGKMKPNFIYGDIVTRFRYIISLFESWANEKNISLEFSATPQEILMDYDEEKITQIISNLISNAIKHTPSNGKVSVTVNAPHSSKMLEIRVHDTGSGIGAEDLPFIFDRFYQSPRAAVGGTGIGLSLTKTLVELLGGSIKVNSTLNVGSTFAIRLPITANALQTTTTNQIGPALVPHHYDDELKFMPPLESVSDKPIALIIEDHPEVAQFVATCLKRDFSTMIASDGDEGIRKAFEHIPDLIVSDVMMPHKDGFEVCATLKKDIQTSHIPVILLTGRGDQASLMQGIQYGADAYVVKPFEPEELVLRATKLFELRKKLSEYYRTHAGQEQVAVPAESSPIENEFLRKIRLFIEEHINDPQFNMHMLCQHMAMSHPQLHRKITALTGESTGKFVRSVRLTKAIELLKSSDLTVSEIAYETGFSEPGYFTKVFSKEYQMTPTEYRGRIA